MRLFCAIWKHRPNRSRVWNDGLDFRAPCRWCGTPMLRDVNKQWRPFDEARDTHPARKPRRRTPEPPA